MMPSMISIQLPGAATITGTPVQVRRRKRYRNEYEPT